jgi:hypothetical protein
LPKLFFPKSKVLLSKGFALRTLVIWIIFPFYVRTNPSFIIIINKLSMENNGNLHPRVNREISYNSSPTLASFAFPDVGHKVPASVATDVQTQEDEISSNLSELISNLPSKVYENCQRTARVIMLSELEKTVMKSKKLKLELSKKL